MQKIFIRYLCYVMIIALLAILLLNYILQGREARNRMVENSEILLDQVALTLENNDTELTKLTADLGEDYLTRARAFAYIISMNPDVLKSQEELVKIKGFLKVDELHVIDENGILTAGTIPKYFGMDFRSSEQTSEFLRLLDEPDSYLIQDVMPNGAEKKIFQYVGVLRLDKAGIVQVGLSPKRLLEAKQKNELSYIFSMVSVDSKSGLFAISPESGEILAHTDKVWIGQDAEDMGLTGDYYEQLENGGFKTVNGVKKYYLLSKYKDLIIGRSVNEENLYSERFGQMVLISTYLLFTFLMVIFVINRLLKKQIVNGVHRIMNGLENITDGNLKIVVEVEDNPEFKQLSRGINKMVRSVLEATGRVSRIIDMVDLSIGVFEYHDETNQVIANEHLWKLLLISPKEAKALYLNKIDFIVRLKKIMTNREPEEDEIYKISEIPETWVKIHMASETTGTFGVVNDVTRDMHVKRRIKYERDYDSLTGLCKMEKFRTLVNILLSTGGNLEFSAMVMLDLDRFKEINDRYGHDWGDVYLKIFAKCLMEFNGERGIAARRSGDEFCVFLYRYGSQDEIRALFNDFYQRIEENKIIFPDNSKRSIRISAGIAWCGGELNNMDTLMKASDIALYDAKKNGRGQWAEYIKTDEAADI